MYGTILESEVGVFDEELSIKGACRDQVIVDSGLDLRCRAGEGSATKNDERLVRERSEGACEGGLAGAGLADDEDDAGG